MKASVVPENMHPITENSEITLESQKLNQYKKDRRKQEVAGRMMRRDEEEVGKR